MEHAHQLLAHAVDPNILGIDLIMEARQLLVVLHDLFGSLLEDLVVGNGHPLGLGAQVGLVHRHDDLAAYLAAVQERAHLFVELGDRFGEPGPEDFELGLVPGLDEFLQHDARAADARLDLHAHVGPGNLLGEDIEGVRPVVQPLVQVGRDPLLELLAGLDHRAVRLLHPAHGRLPLAGRGEGGPLQLQDPPHAGLEGLAAHLAEPGHPLANGFIPGSVEPPVPVGPPLKDAPGDPVVVFGTLLVRLPGLVQSHRSLGVQHLHEDLHVRPDRELQRTRALRHGGRDHHVLLKGFDQRPRNQEQQNDNGESADDFYPNPDVGKSHTLPSATAFQPGGTHPKDNTSANRVLPLEIRIQL
ncbi:hypothetical protein [Pseudodesulfovibrio indicus]|uniref:hypothetical protein n=1 Tax=Pseudodesulfovibrio indicus TaxID=1716143 RepID=UPI00292D5F5C|nr:hypothetical protein [Pseudodesulfovibrio indicus]